MNRQTFNEHITDRQFRQLFISEMGWNNPQGQAELVPVSFDDKEFYVRAIAERNGFHVLECEVKQIPTSSVCKKLDFRLCKQAADYILIFYQPRGLHHLWMAPVKKVEKRDLVFIEYETLPQADFLYSKIDGLSFPFDERTTIMEVKERVQGTFLVNAEKLTKDFYTGFRKQHNAFVAFIKGIDDDIANADNRNKQWYASIMLNRLMFCYFIQKKGFLDNNVNYLRDKLAWVQRERGANRFFKTFYRGFLKQLFHDGLDNPRHSDSFISVYGRIPYLNGGMFDEHLLEIQYADIEIDDDAFISLFNFFDQWHWHLDDRHTASGRDINPDVLGYIFEQYINDRAAMGAYYTKEDITEYIAKNCILPFLMDKVRTATQESERDFQPNGYVWQTLAQSGANYIYDAVKKGYSADWQERIPDYIREGIDTTSPGLLERRARWNEKTDEEFALPTEIWRETVERLQRCDNLLEKICGGEITHINDFITYNLDIRQFVYDLLANAQDHLFVGHFYHAMQHVTILDPTCGSGAFLFAAMNILEPLYVVCIERMEEWNAENPHLFKDELDEINRKYRSNRQYFIYKSIILRNLYGVDIMAEATEIAKLRLFLKMVAVVDVDLRADNLGLEPLPDIDFSIRCGNTLVGYATEKELERDLVQGDMFANAEFRDKVHEEMEKAAKAFEQFKAVQFRQDEDMATFKEAKQVLRKRLKALDEMLDKHLYASTTNAYALSFGRWKESHQPFHWLAEYYEIIHGNGGFDVIIGNPPYVVYRQNNYIYSVPATYETRPCSNLYAFILERCLYISGKRGHSGYIIPISSVSNDKFIPLLRIMKDKTLSWYSSFSNRPGKLFDNVEQRLTIVISKRQENACNYYASRYLHWYVECRPVLFGLLSYYNNKTWDDSLSLFKLGSNLEDSLCSKIYTSGNSHRKKLSSYMTGNYTAYYHNAPTYFVRAMSFKPNSEKGMRESSHYKAVRGINKYLIPCILNSSVFYWFFKNISNCRDFSFREIAPFPLGEIDDLNFSVLGEKLETSYVKNKSVKNRLYPSGIVYYEEYYPAKSKPIIDEIDKVLAKHYGFTDEELDFIINYDIKYRMGDELDTE